MYTMASVPQKWCFGVGVVLLVLATCVLGKASSRLAAPAPCSLRRCTPADGCFPFSLIHISKRNRTKGRLYLAREIVVVV